MMYLGKFSIVLPTCQISVRKCDMRVFSSKAEYSVVNHPKSYWEQTLAAFCIQSCPNHVGATLPAIGLPHCSRMVRAFSHAVVSSRPKSVSRVKQKLGLLWGYNGIRCGYMCIYTTQIYYYILLYIYTIIYILKYLYIYIYNIYIYNIYIYTYTIYIYNIYNIYMYVCIHIFVV